MTAIKWTGMAGDSSWYTAGNWTGNMVPGAGANVVFDDGGTWDIAIRGNDPSLGELTVFRDHLVFDDAGLRLDAVPPKQGATIDLAIGRGASVSLVDDALVFATNFVQIGTYTNGTISAGTLTCAAYSGGVSSGVQVIDGLFAVTGTQAVWGQASAGTFVSSVGGPGQAEILVSAGGDFGQYTAGGELDIGTGLGSGLVLVTDPNSLLTIDRITIGEDIGGTLAIENHAAVNTLYLDIGGYGGGTVTVTGGGTLQASSGILLGSDVVPVTAVMEITNHGSVYTGTSGLELEQGTLKIDPTAVLFGSVVSLGGHFDALPSPGSQGGIVTLGQAIAFGPAYSSDPFGGVNTLGSEGGAVLQLTGMLDAHEQGTTLEINSGHVVLANAGNEIAAISLAAGSLAIAVTGADGGGTISFHNAYSPTLHTTSLLVVDSGVQLGDTLTGFDGGSRIDLKGFAFGSGVADALSNGTLTLHDDSSSVSLVLAGTYSAAEFTFVKDAGVGTLVEFHKV